MPVFTNDEFLSKNIRIQNPDGSKSVFLYYEPSYDGLSMSHVNPDVNAVPTFEDFNFDLSNKSEFYAAESMTSIYIYFDSNIGSSTTISSQNGTISGISPFGSNYFYFNYFCGFITDNLTITSYNSNNTKSKTVVIPITLKTTPSVPLGFTNTPTTQNYTYNNIVVNFNKAVKSISSITSLNQPSQTITYTTNNTSSIVLTNYKTPSNISDTLTFNGVVDTSDISNTSSVSKTIDNLKVGPSFVSVSSSNTISQNWTYTDIEAVFTKDIIQNPTTPITVTASSGNQPTNIRIVDGKIKFDWTTSNVSSSTLSFNNLYASDFTFDDGAVETTTFNLSSQPTTPQWYANQPVSKNTTYSGVEVNFNKRISSVDIVSDGTISNKTINARGNVQFDIITGSTNSTYTFNNILAEDKGRNTGLVLTTGPIITSYANSTGTTNDNKVLTQSSGQTFSFTFNKSISNEPTITLNSGTGVYVSKVNNTLYYNLSNITGSSNLITFGTIQASDASSSSGLTVPLNPVPALTFDLISDVSQPDISKDTYDVGTEYDLYAKFNTPPDLNANSSGVSVSCPNATVGAITSVDGNNKYKFKLTPDNASTNQISINNAKDVNNFVYPLFTSGNLTFNAVAPIPYAIIDGSDPSLFTLSGTDITDINVNNITFITIGGEYIANSVNGKGIVKFNDGSEYIHFNPTVIPTTGWSLSILVNSKTDGIYNAGIIGDHASFNLNFLRPGSNIHSAIGTTMDRVNQEVSASVYEVDRYYHIMFTSMAGPTSPYDGTAYYVNGLLSAQSYTITHQSRLGNLKDVVLNTYTTSARGSTAYLGSYPEVAYWNKALSHEEVKTYYQATKSKWGSLVA